jgi:hypothetical protein
VAAAALVRAERELEQTRLLREQEAIDQQADQLAHEAACKAADEHAQQLEQARALLQAEREREAQANQAILDQVQADGKHQAAAAQAAEEQARVAHAAGQLIEAAAVLEQEKAAAALAALALQQQELDDERASLSTIEQQLVQQNLAGSARRRALAADVACLALDTAAAQEADAHALQQQALAERAADLAHARQSAQRAAQQADVDKCDAQKALLVSATAHAALQRKVAAATVEMALARQTLLALENARLELEQQTLGELGVAIEAERQRARDGVTIGAQGVEVDHVDDSIDAAESSTSAASDMLARLNQASVPGGALWRAR